MNRAEKMRRVAAKANAMADAIQAEEPPRELTHAERAYMRVWAAVGPRPSIYQRRSLVQLAARLGVTP